MILTALLVSVALSFVVLFVWAIYDYWRRRQDFRRVTIPAVAHPFPELPKMVGLSKTIEDMAADQAAKKLAADIEFDLFTPRPTPPRPPPKKGDCKDCLPPGSAPCEGCCRVATSKEALDAMFGYYDDKKADDDWSTVVPPKPKKKRKTKKKVSRVGKARRKGPRAKR